MAELKIWTNSEEWVVAESASDAVFIMAENGSYDSVADYGLAPKQRGFRSKSLQRFPSEVRFSPHQPCGYADLFSSSLLDPSTLSLESSAICSVLFDFTWTSIRSTTTYQGCQRSPREGRDLILLGNSYIHRILFRGKARSIQDTPENWEEVPSDRPFIVDCEEEGKISQSVGEWTRQNGRGYLAGRQG